MILINAFNLKEGGLLFLVPWVGKDKSPSMSVKMIMHMLLITKNSENSGERNSVPKKKNLKS